MTNIVALVEELGEEVIDAKVRQPIREARQRYRRIDTRLTVKSDRARREAMIAAAKFLCEEGVPPGIGVQDDLPNWIATALERTEFWQKEFGRHIAASTCAGSISQGGLQGLVDAVAAVVQSKAAEAHTQHALDQCDDDVDEEELLRQMIAAYQPMLPEFVSRTTLRLYARRWREVVLTIARARKTIREELLAILGSAV